MARSMAVRVEMAGVMRRRAAARASSWAMRFIGSAMAMTTSSGVARTGTMV